MTKSKSKFYKLSLSLLIKNLAIFYYYLAKFFILILLIIILGALIISLFDQIKFSQSLYLSFITATTVGYGDLTPVSSVSKIVAVILGVLGIVFTGTIVAVTVEGIRLTLKEKLSPEEIEKFKT